MKKNHHLSFVICSLSFVICLLLPSQGQAQDKVETNLSATLVSKYMWRGMTVGGISLQPEVNISWQGLSLNAWGTKSFNKDDKEEIDLTLGYSRWGFNIGVTDYWTAGIDPKNRFFYYGGKELCPHQLEGNIGYTCKYGSIQAYTMFYGNDYKINGKQAYSTFIELSIPFRACGIDWNLRAGITPFESAGSSYQEKVEGEDGRTKTVIRGDWLYGESFTCNMASIRATKNLTFKHCQVPVFVELHTNPYLQTVHLLLGVSIATL